MIAAANGIVTDVVDFIRREIQSVIPVASRWLVALVRHFPGKCQFLSQDPFGGSGEGRGHQIRRSDLNRYCHIVVGFVRLGNIGVGIRFDDQELGAGRNSRAELNELRSRVTVACVLVACWNRNRRSPVGRRNC